MTKIELYDSANLTTLESNKSPHGLAIDYYQDVYS